MYSVSGWDGSTRILRGWFDSGSPVPSCFHEAPPSLVRQRPERPLEPPAQMIFESFGWKAKVWTSPQLTRNSVHFPRPTAERLCRFTSGTQVALGLAGS